jgi:hypothetical protein
MIAVISSGVSIHEALAEMNTYAVEKSPSADRRFIVAGVRILLLNRRGFLDFAE